MCPLGVARVCRPRGLRRALALLLACTLAGSPALAAEPVALSEHYRLEPVPGSLFRREHGRLLVKTSAGGFEHLGSVRDPHWAEKYPFGAAGLVAKNVAVSADGRSIVYHHNASLAGRESRKESGLYHHAVGAGETLLFKDAEFGIAATRYPKPLPKDAIAIRRTTGDEAVTAQGANEPLLLLGASALHRAAMAGDAQAIARLGTGDALNARNHWEQTALDLAVLVGQGKAALQLLALGAEVRAEKSADDLVFIASAYRRAEVLDELLRRKLPYLFYEENGISPFHSLLRFYLDHGLFPKRATDFDSFAATLEVYLAHGADLSLRDAKGRTLLHLAPHSSVPAPLRGIIAAHLIGKGIDVEVVDALGNTALHYAAELDIEERSLEAWEKWKLPALRAIAERMKSVDSRNSAGLTPLQLAVQRNQMRTAEYLVSRGADASGEFVHGGIGPKISGQSIRARIDSVKKSPWWKYE